MIKEPKISVQEPTPRKAGGKKAKRPGTSSGIDSKLELEELSVSLVTQLSTLHFRRQLNVVTGQEDSDIQFIATPSQALQVPQSNRNRSRSRSESPSGRFRLEDLPGHPQSVRAWKQYFVPTLLLFQGAQLQPWNWQDGASVPLVQAIWDATLGDEFPLKVVPNECVHALVSVSLIAHPGLIQSSLQPMLTSFVLFALQANQKLWDWRSSLRHAAEVVVGHYLDQSPHTLDAENRGMFCEKIIDGARFLYSNPLSQKTTVRRSSQLGVF